MIGTPWLIAFAAAASTSVLVTPLVIRFSVARGLMDIPGGRSIHSRPVPSVGGVAVAAGAIVGLIAIWLAETAGLITAEQVRFPSGLLAGGAILFVTGLVDDQVGLRPRTKLAAQTAAALVTYYLGFRIAEVSLGTGTDFALGPLALPITVLWLVGVTNAFNLIDGLDGLAVGIALIAIAATAAVAVRMEHASVVLACASLAGGLVGFMRYNTNPARIFLGDSGSLFIGFSLALLTIEGAKRADDAVLAVVPICALALPLLDTTLAVARRWLRGTPVSAADRRHIHHRIMARGLSHPRAVQVLHAAALGLALLGVGLALASPPLAFWVGLAGGGLSLLLFLEAMRRLRYHEFEEFGGALVSALRRGRRIIGDRIQARDASEIIASARDLEEVRTVLAGHAAHFTFVGMEICRESAAGRIDTAGGRTGAWKLDYPVTDMSGQDPIVLRIWCHRDARFRPYGAERVARIIGPSLEEWLREHPWIQVLGSVSQEPDEAESLETRVLRSV